jgi:hypothetical protein
MLQHRLNGEYCICDLPPDARHGVLARPDGQCEPSLNDCFDEE